MVLLPLTLTMLFDLLAVLALVCILVLQGLAVSQRVKLGYSALALTFVVWAWRLSLAPSGTGTWWLYVLPMLWLILLFRYGFPGLPPREYPPLTGEPYATQESLSGAPVRRQALTFYFLLVLISLILSLLFFEMTLLAHAV